MRKVYVSLLTVLIFLFASVVANAQLTGTKTIPGDYATIAAAVTDLNAQGVGAGGVTFNIAAGHTESITARINLTATGTVANQIVFQKSGVGANPVITSYTGGTGTPALATPDGIWSLQGSDYVTIDGIDLAENGANSGTALMEYGYGLFKTSTSDGAQNNTIKNCVVTLNRANNTTATAPMVEGSVGILVINSLPAAATTSLTPVSAAGTNSGNKIYSNLIQNSNYGIALSGYAATTPFTLGDSGNDIGGSSLSTGNTVLNFGGAAAAANPSAGIRANNQWSVNISYNTVNSNNGSGVNHASTLRGIYAQAGTSANATINNNTVFVSGGGTTSQVAAIENAIGSTASGNTISITNNTVSGSYLTATSGAFYGIYNTATAATVNIESNAVTGMTYSASGLTGTGVVYGIFSSGAAPLINIRSNTVNNISRTGTTGGTTIGIYTSSGTNQTIKLNTVGNLSIDGTGTTSTMYGIQTSTGTIIVDSNIVHTLSCLKTSGTSALYGIYNVASPTNENFNYNKVYNITHAGTGTTYGMFMNTVTGTRTVSFNEVYGITTGGTTVAGILQTTSSPNIFRNKIYNIQSTSTGSPTVSGLGVTSLGTAGVANIYNNLIGGLTAPNAGGATAAAPTIRGINLTAATANSSINIYYNTIYLEASSTGSGFGSAGLFATVSATATTAALTLQNNIIVNKSTASAPGLAVAYQRSGTSLANYTGASNNNLFYAGSPSSSNLIFFDGTNAEQLLSDFQTRVSPSDAQSVSENPPFLSTTGANATFLHINPAIATLVESGGITVSGITDDFDGDTRNVATPDIGADEGAFTIAANMTYVSSTTTQTNISNVSTNTTNQQVVGIEVVTNGASNPLSITSFTLNTNGTTAVSNIANARLFYTGTNPAFGTGIQFGADIVAPNGAFVIPGVQQLAEGTNYFWLTYDVLCNATGGNVIDAECNSLTVGIPRIPTVQAPAGSRIIVVGPLTGTYTVGTGGNYATLTAAIADVNGKGLGGNTTFKILNNLTEAGAVVIDQWTECGGSNFTLTIKPETGTTPTISANSSTGVIVLNGADRVTIDGSNSGGTDKSLTLSNNSTTAGTTVIWVKSLGTGLGASDNTIKNCNIQAGIAQNTATGTTYGIVVGGTTLSASPTSITAGDDNDNIVIQGNSFVKVRYGIYIRGGSGANPNTGTMIKNNIIGPSAFGADEIGKAGIVIREEEGTQITGNTIRFVGGDYANTTAGTDRVAISLGTDAAWTITSAYIKNAVITNNIISDIVDERTFSAVGIAVGAADASNSTNNLIANNVITNVKANGTSSDQAIGIGLSASNTDLVIFNSIYMTGDTDPNASAATPNESNFGISISSGTAVVNPLIQDNVVYMDLSSSTATSLKNACINVPTTFVWGSGGSNYNDLYYNPANTQSNTGCVGGSGGTFHLTITAWQGAVSQDGNSLQTDPLFNSTTNLRPLPGSQIIGAGIAAGGITTDILGVTRGGPPTIGAYELAGDFTGPTISYTTLTNTACPTNRDLAGVVITDISSVNVIAGTKPRLYFKKLTNANTYNDNTSATDGWKYVESTSSASPFNFTTNYSLINGGVTNGDVIQYFVVAQDVYTTPNVGINSGVFASIPVSVGLTSAAFPIGGAINSYAIVQTVPTSVTIGAAGTYTSLTKAGGLFADINTKGLSGNTTVTILDALVDEDGANALNQITYGCAGPYTLTIQPGPGVSTVLSGSNATALIDLNGADSVTFDGSNNGTMSKNMIIRNTSTTGPTIRFINDANSNTIKNSVVEGGVTSTTSGLILFSTATAGTLGNSGNIISNNTIRDRTDVTAAFGVCVYSSGTTAAPNQNNTVSGNQLFNFTSSGVNIAATGNGTNWDISDNHFYNNLTPSTAQSAITVASANTTADITNNFIGGNAPNAAGSWVNSGNVAVNALNITNGIVNIVDNTIANISTTNTGTTTRTRGINFTASLGSSLIEGNIINNLSSAGGVTSYTGGSQAAVGIHYFPGGYQPITIKGNTIYDISIENTTALTTTSIAAGMMLTNMGGEASGNIIYNIKNKSTGITAGQPPVAAGMYIRFVTGDIKNNMVSLGSTESNNVQYNGFLVAGGEITTPNFASPNFYYNSVFISGTATGTNASHAFLRGDNSATSQLHFVTLKNNLLINTRSGGGSANYAIGNQGTSAATNWSSNYNDLYSSDNSTIGYWNATGYNFANWQATSTGDANSISILPVFTSVTDLHLPSVAGNAAVSNLGTPVTGITTDIDGDIRDLAVPDMGADEFLAPCTGAVGGTAAASPAGPFCGSANTTISSAGYSIGFGSTYLWQYSIDAAFTSPVDIGSVSSTYADLVTGTITSTTYFRLKVTCPSGTAIAYSNVVTVTITPTPSATISYAGTPYCSNAGTATVTNSGTTGGTYSSTAGLSIDASTGAVNLAASTAGTYTVTYAIAAAGGCPLYQTTTTIVVQTAPSATISYVGTPFCSSPGTANVTLTGTTGGTFSSTAGLVINSSTGAVDLGASTVGTYTVTYTIAAAGACPVYQTTAVIDITNSPSAAISYSGSPYCSNGSTASVTRTGSAGGTYSSTAGLSINASTGEITLGTSTPGTYTVTYSIAAAGGCSAFQTTTSITITAAPAATISYAGSPYCSNGGTATVTQTGTTGGTYTSTAGLSINASTGAVTLGTSTPGTYTVTYTVAAANGCAQFQTTGSITITAAPAATISYAGSPYCSNGGTATVTQTGTTGGTYTSTAGLSINASTGAVTLGTSTPGTYTVTYTVAAANGCAQFQTTGSITITAAPAATISYAGSPYCSNGGTASVTQTGTAGGTYTSTAGLSINASTGAVNLGASTAGTYTVTYTVAAANGCAQFQTTASITVTAAPTATISYAGSPFCISGTVAVTQTGTAGGTYSSTAGLSINASTGMINLAASTAGAYTITYTVAAANGCAQLQATTNIVISANGSWLGTVSSNWNTAANWCGGVPTSTTDVIIPSTAPNMPNLSGANGAARNISLANGSTLTIGAGGILDLYGNITGAGTFNATAGSIAFRSATGQTVPGFTATNVTMNGAGGVTPAGNTTVTGTLTLTNGNITLGNNSITLNNSSTGSAASHIITNGTGSVVVTGLAASQARTIPVGADATSYNPATLAANAGHTTDNFTVRVQQGVFVNGVSGTTFTTHVADRMWIINEAATGGSNVNVTLQWTGAQELTSFNRTKCYVMQHNGTTWSQGTPTAATGTDPYTQTKQNVTTFSPFAVETERIPRPITGIYPNPTSDVLNVVTDLLQAGPVVFSVYDMKGRLVYRRQAALTAGLSQTTLNLVGLSAGTYVVKASTALNREFLSQKFIKVN